MLDFRENFAREIAAGRQVPISVHALGLRFCRGGRALAHHGQPIQMVVHAVPVGTSGRRFYHRLTFSPPELVAQQIVEAGAGYLEVWGENWAEDECPFVRFYWEQTKGWARRGAEVIGLASVGNGYEPVDELPAFILPTQLYPDV